jgi:hypothetical protein
LLLAAAGCQLQLVAGQGPSDGGCALVALYGEL